jgi:opacity protein-like surface antigen
MGGPRRRHRRPGEGPIDLNTEESIVRRKLLIPIIALALILATTSSFAGRPDKSWKNWFGHFSGGYTQAQGDFGDIVDDDWTLAGGATYWPETWPIGLDLELGYNDFDLSSAAIRAINDAISEDPANSGSIDGGDVSIWSLTADAIWSPGSGRISPYIMAGVGAYYVDNRITTTGLVYYPPTCNPWYWWCYPGGVGPGTLVVGSQSTTEFGYNVGIGINWEMGSGSQLFLEAKYHSIQMDPETTEMVPVVIGYRW